jgi:hypothetical protein
MSYLPVGFGNDLASRRTSIYPSTVQNWYTQYPYTFKFVDAFGTKQTFHLPISPYNINITTHFATNVISTMYGTIEEHSEQRYYDIAISGTTGMSPRYYDSPDLMQRNDSTDGKLSATGRGSYGVRDSLLGNLGGFLKRTQALVDNAANQVRDLIGDTNGSTGIDLNKTGYMAFHNFYKFLLVYKKDISGEEKKGIRIKGPLVFINYKDNNQYNVVIQNFQLTKDVSNPMLYNYNLSMRAYNMTQADATEVSNDLTNRISELGLDSINNNSLFSKLANKTRQAKNAAYSAIAAAKGAGG